MGRAQIRSDPSNGDRQLIPERQDGGERLEKIRIPNLVLLLIQPVLPDGLQRQLFAETIVEDSEAESHRSFPALGNTRGPGNTQPWRNVLPEMNVVLPFVAQPKAEPEVRPHDPIILHIHAKVRLADVRSWVPGRDGKLAGAAAQRADLRVRQTLAVEQDSAAIPFERRQRYRHRLTRRVPHDLVVPVQQWSCAARKPERPAEILPRDIRNRHGTNARAPSPRMRTGDVVGVVLDFPSILIDHGVPDVRAAANKGVADIDGGHGAVATGLRGGSHELKACFVDRPRAEHGCVCHLNQVFGFRGVVPAHTQRQLSNTRVLAADAGVRVAAHQRIVLMQLVVEAGTHAGAVLRAVDCLA